MDKKLTFALLCFLAVILLFIVTHHFTEKFIDEPSPFLSVNAPANLSNTKPVDDAPLFTFANNICDPSCCGKSDLSCSHGCVCKTKEQETMLNTRGMNSVGYDEF